MRLLITCCYYFLFVLWQIPNSLGVIFAVGQLILYVVYYKSTKRQMEERKRKGEIGLAEVVVANGDSNKVSEWANN